MPIKNYSTSIDAQKSAFQIMALLQKKGAHEVAIMSDATGSISGLTWYVRRGEIELPFRMPVNVKGVQDALVRDSKGRGKKVVAHSQTTYQHARNVAWRILFDWVENQMALLESGQAVMEEIFLPYMLVSGDRTVFKALSESHFKMLPEGES